MQVNTVLQPGAVNLSSIKGEQGVPGTPGDTGADATPKNVRLIKITITITASGPTISYYEQILERGDIWESIVSSQFTLHATKMYGKIISFLNSNNATKKVKAIVEQDSVSFTGIAQQNFGSFNLKITEATINEIDWGIFDSDNASMNWTDFSSVPAILPLVFSFNIQLIAED